MVQGACRGSQYWASYPPCLPALEPDYHVKALQSISGMGRVLAKVDTVWALMDDGDDQLSAPELAKGVAHLKGLHKFAMGRSSIPDIH